MYYLNTPIKNTLALLACFEQQDYILLFARLSLCSIFNIFLSRRTERQWRDLAFCLSMLSFNERGIRKLQENFTCFHDKLAEEHVYQSFLTIVGKSKKFAKPEVKVNLILRVRPSPARMINLEKISVIVYLGSQDFPTQIVDHQDCREHFILDVLSHFSKLTNI